MREKEPVVGSTDYGKDEDSAESLLKKHRALMSDLDAFKSTIEVCFYALKFFVWFCSSTVVACNFFIPLTETIHFWIREL